MTEPYGLTVFCDDIRYEVSGKLTLVGCYSSEMIFTGPAPGMIPSLAALVNIRIPKTIEFKTLKVVVIKQEGEETTEILNAKTEIDRGDLEKGIGNSTDEFGNEKIWSMTLPCNWTPFHMKEEGFIKVRAYLDDERKIKLGVLKVNFAASSDASLPSEN